MREWIENKLLFWFYRKYGDKMYLPLIIKKHWGNDWIFLDRYGRRYTIRETGEYEGTPLIVMLEER